MKMTIFIFSLVVSTSLWANSAVINKVEFTNGKINIKHAGLFNDNPQVTVNEKQITLNIKGASISPKINKASNGAVVSTTQSGDELVTIKVAIPYSLKGKESSVSTILKDGAIDVNFSKGELVKKQVSRSPSVIVDSVLETAKTDLEAEKLDESYLEALEKKSQKVEAVVVNEDRVNVTQASTTKPVSKEPVAAEPAPKSKFSVATYIGKFVAFLSLMILGFYGVLMLFKKGVIKKGKLGFLHSTKLVEVLSTTHVAPKRTLMMVKAHKQVFLISNSESGMQLISEIQDVTGLIKTGEAEITGSNFDTNLVEANTQDREFKLKEVTNSKMDDDFSLDDMLNEKTTPAAKSIEKNPVQDQVRLSDQIKTKIKSLKQLQ